ncbi:MAG: Flp family type IVb pilin [Bryobacterales bacterium]|nr:Flp family type IVb pilin [Bryobacterales bacterium]
MENRWSKINSVLQTLLRDRSGQDLIEYALMAAFLTIAVGALFPTNIAPNISAVFSKVSTMLSQAS